MFILSFKTSRLKLISFSAMAVAVFLIVVYAISSFATSPTDTSPTRVINAATNEQRIAFIESFGYELRTEPLEVAEVAIPTEFDEIYNEYNKIQKEQGFDLTPYRGKRVTRYTYKVKNYPGQDENVRADILVYENRVIGGNICSVLEDGFVHGIINIDEVPEN